MRRSLILCLSDLQIPFEHRDALDFTLHVKKTFSKPGDKVQVINLGDEFDQHAKGKYPSDPDGYSPGHEIKVSIEHAKPWYKAFPEMSLCISNHSFRGHKKAFEAGIPKAFINSIGTIYECPKKWSWAHRFVVDGIVFEHGEHVSGTDAALRAAIQNRMSTVIGHQHSHGGVIYSGTFHNFIFGMNVGCLIDVDQYAFKYGIALRKKPTLGIGVIINQVPFFVPMVLDKNKRWIRRLI
jgi:hypothetical protein